MKGFEKVEEYIKRAEKLANLTEEFKKLTQVHSLESKILKNIEEIFNSFIK